MKRFDPRMMVAFGLAMFGVSCFMNGFMSHDYAGDQLRLSMIVRAIGLPFVITPLSALTTGGIEKEQTGSASSMFNMMRNLGGSLGTSILATIVTQREQFHSLRLHERISDSDLPVRNFLHHFTETLAHHSGASHWSAHQQALLVLSNHVRQESYVMAFNDAFIATAIVLFLGAFTVLLLNKPQGAMESGGHYTTGH